MGGFLDIPKVLVPKPEVVKESWNKHLATPLTEGEKCIVIGYAKNSKYVSVKHGPAGAKVESSFRLSHFNDVKGKSINPDGAKK